jgi:hypothetical protein
MVRSHNIEHKKVINPANDVEVRPCEVSGVFY